MFGKLNPRNTVILACDIQEKFRKLIIEFDSVVRSTEVLLDAATVFDIDVIVTEQYPKGLLRTVPELNVKERKNVTVFEKTKFSMMTPEVEEFLASRPDKKQEFVISGLETHVCVLQTCLDLLESGRSVHVIVDGVSSQRLPDRQVALQRLKDAGALMTTTESVLFMLLKDASSTHFKDVSNLAKNLAKKPSMLGYL